MSSSDLNYWRRFFKTTRHDIFETIESAIHVAATDYPEEFKDKQEYLKQTISTALSSNMLQCIPSEDTYNTKPKRKNRRKEKIIDEIFNKAKMNFVENWSSSDDDGGGGGGDDNACISDWMKKKSEKKQRKRKGKRVAKDIKVTKRCDRRAKEPTFSSLLPSFPTFSSFTNDPFFSSFPTFSSFTKEPTFSSWRAKDAHTETGSSSICMPNTSGTSNDRSATNLVAKEVAEVATEPTFSSFTEDPIFSSFPTFSSFTKKPTFSSWGAKDAHTETGSTSMGLMPDTSGTSNDGSATNLVAKEVVEVEVEVEVGVGVGVERDTLTKKSDLLEDVSKEVEIGVGVGVEVERDTLTKKSDLIQDVSKIRDALMKLKGQPVIAYDLLMRLDKMDISAHVLKVTDIATIVSSYAKDGHCSDSSQTRLLASCLLESWCIILDKWLNNSNRVRDNEKVTVATEIEKVMVATEIVEPKSVIEATRTGSLQFHEGPSKPQSSRPIFDIRSRGSTNARCMVAGQPAERYKNRQLTSTSQVQIGSSSRANNNTSLKTQPRYGLHQGPKLTIKENPSAKNKMEVPAPTKKIEEVNRVRESLEIARRKFQERFQKSEPDARCMVTCQPAERHHFKNRQLTVSSQVQIGGSSKAYGDTSFKSQPRYGLQGPKLSTVKESLDVAKNKLKGPVPAEKIKEDPICESLELAKRKLQERLQKSEQVKRHNTGLQNADKDTPIGELLSRYRRGPC